MYDIFELENSLSKPYEHLTSKEFIEGVMKAGSLISMLENKKINSTTMFALLLERSDYQKFFTEITSSESFREAVLNLLYLNPSLVKSKITKSALRKLHGRQKKTINRSGKTNL